MGSDAFCNHFWYSRKKNWSSKIINIHLPKCALPRSNSGIASLINTLRDKARWIISGSTENFRRCKKKRINEETNLIEIHTKYVIGRVKIKVNTKEGHNLLGIFHLRLLAHPPRYRFLLCSWKQQTQTRPLQHVPWWKGRSLHASTVTAGQERNNKAFKR